MNIVLNAHSHVCLLHNVTQTLRRFAAPFIQLFHPHIESHACTRTKECFSEDSIEEHRSVARLLSISELRIFVTFCTSKSKSEAYVCKSLCLTFRMNSFFAIQFIREYNFKIQRGEEIYYTNFRWRDVLG